MIRRHSLIKPALLLLILLFSCGLFLRSYALGEESFWLDEAISSSAAVNFLEHGWPTHPSGREYPRAFLNTFLIALSFRLLGVTEAAGRVPSVVFGVLAIPIAYLLGKKLGNERVGLIIALLVTFSTVQIAWSRQARMYQQLQFFLLLTLYLFERFLDKTNGKKFFLVSLSGVALVLSHVFGYMLLIPILAWFLIEKTGWIKGQLLELGHKRVRKITSIAFVATVIILILFAWRLIPPPNLLPLFSTRVDYASTYIRYLTGELWPFLFLAIPGAVISIAQRRRNLLYVMIILFPLYIISYHILGYHERYVFMLIPLIFVLAAFTLEHIYTEIGELLKNRGNAWLRKTIPTLALLIPLAAFLLAGNFTFNPRSHYDLGPTATQGEFRHAYEYIAQNWENGDIVVSSLTPLTYWYLCRSDYWIQFSYWGFSTPPKKDVYTSAAVIGTANDMRELVSEERGWVVLEIMALGKMNQSLRQYIEEELEFVGGASGRGVWVYRWR